MNIKPNPEFLKSMSLKLRQEWAEALRSGDYVQSEGRLKTYSGYCCLGVYCELKGVDILHCHSEPNQTRLNKNDAIFNTVESGNPRIGLRNCINKSPVLSSTLNDGGYSFDQIADLIHPEGIKHAT